jgi:hypothetical protein
MWSFTTPSSCVFFFPFEQFIGQQMIQFQNSISKCLHRHTLFNMFFNKTTRAHCARILSYFNPRAGIWFTCQLVFLTFQLFSLVFYTVFHTQLGLPHSSIASIPWCVCTHPIDSLGIHLLHCAHGNERIETYDAIRDTFAAIARDASFHMEWKQLRALLSITFNSSCQWIDIVLTKYGIHTLANIVIADLT